MQYYSKDKNQKKDHRSVGNSEELSTRTIQVLYRNGFIHFDSRGYPIYRNACISAIDEAKVKKAVLNGSIWDARNLGPRIYGEICRWLHITVYYPSTLFTHYNYEDNRQKWCGILPPRIIKIIEAESKKLSISQSDYISLLIEKYKEK